MGHIGFLGTESAERVGARQVNQPDSPSFKNYFAYYTAHRHSTVVTGVFMSSGGCIEEGCLAAVGIAHQRDCDGFSLWNVFGLGVRFLCIVILQCDIRMGELVGCLCRR